MTPLSEPANKLLALGIVTLMVFVASYLAFAFLNLSLDPSDWPSIARAGVIILTVLGFLAAAKEARS